MKKEVPVMQWLLQGDVSVQYQVHRDLLHSSKTVITKLQKRIATEGWGKQFMNLRATNDMWGNGLYNQKWTSTHYTLLEVKNMGFPANDKRMAYSTQLMLDLPRDGSGGIDVTEKGKQSDVCVNGMILNFASYFLEGDRQLNSIVDYLLKVQMKDGGWNCRHRHGDTHSSLHTTLSVLEGLHEFQKSGNNYKAKEVNRARKQGFEFILQHHLYRSHRTGNVIRSQFTLLSYPCRWKYDILRALDHFRDANLSYDKRMEDALLVILKKRDTKGTWPLQGVHKGQVHFAMEQSGKPSRWNTLRALRVLTHFGKL